MRKKNSQVPAYQRATVVMDTLTMDRKGILKPCSACGKKNRLPFNRLDQTGRCGSCGADMPPPDLPIAIRHVEHFDILLASSPIPVVVDFWAPWCGPCRMMEPELKRIAAAGSGAFVLAKVNVDELGVLSQRYGIRSIPTMVKFVNGREEHRQIGALQGNALERFVRSPDRSKKVRGSEA